MVTDKPLIARILKMRPLLPVVATTLLLGGCATTARFEGGAAVYERYLAQATQGLSPAAARRVTQLCHGPDAGPSDDAEPSAAPDPQAARVAPAQVFDNLFFLGDRRVSVWAITTPEGIILIDAQRPENAETVVTGLQSLGLDPATVRYVIVTHGHSDHYGGAKMLQDRYGARVAMGAPDWPTVRSAERRAGAPRRDITLAAGSTITLGGQTVRVFPTPGHTPGTVSLLFRVFDRGVPHNVALWGGGFPYESIPAMRSFARSAERFSPIVRAAGADVTLSNHPANDESIPKLGALAKRGAADAHPFVGAPSETVRRVDMMALCARAFVARKGG